MSDRFDDSDSSWEFVGKDTSDSEDEPTRYGRIRHDTGLPESVVHDVNVASLNVEVARSELGSDIEVCLQEDVAEEQPEASSLQAGEVETIGVNESSGSDVGDCDVIIETADSESDVEKIEEEGMPLVNPETNEQEIKGVSSFTVGTSTSSSASQSSVRDMGFNIVDSTETVTSEKVEKPAYVDIEELITLEDKSSQTDVCSVCDANVATYEVEVTSTASETDITPTSSETDVSEMDACRNAGQTMLLAAVFITALGIGFSLGAMYGPLHNVMPRNTTPGNQFQTTHTRRTAEQNIHQPDNSLSLDNYVDLKSRLSKRSISVNQLKGRISKLRMENEKLKTNIRLATSQHQRDQQMQHYYKTMALRQEQIASDLQMKALVVSETYKRRMKIQANRLQKKKQEIVRYKHGQQTKVEEHPHLHETALQTLYSVVHEKTNNVMLLRNLLEQSKNENIQEKEEHVAQESMLKSSLALQQRNLLRLRGQLRSIRRIKQEQDARLMEEAFDVDEVEQYLNHSQCTFEQNEDSTANHDSSNPTPPTFALNLSVPIFDSLSNAVLVPDLANPYPKLHKLFLSSISSSKDEDLISYVPSVYYDYAVQAEGVCRLNIRKMQRNAYMLILKNKYMNSQLTKTLQEASQIQQQLMLVQQNFSDLLKLNEEKAKNESGAVCKPTLKQCVSSIINTTAIQPYVNFTMATRAVNHFTRELNRSAIHAWNKIIKKVRKINIVKERSRNEFEQSTSGPKNNKRKERKERKNSDQEKKPKKEHGEKKWWKNKHRELKDKSGKIFEKIHKTVKKTISKGGERVGEAIGAISHSVKDKGSKMKEGAHKLYRNHKDKPRKYYEKAKKFGGQVLENIYNATGKVMGPPQLPKEKGTIYCPSASSSNKGCSQNVESFKAEKEQEGNWYLKRYEGREHERNNQHDNMCISDDWYSKRVQLRELLREEERERREYNEMLRQHIMAHHAEKETGNWRESVDDMVYFSFPHEKKDDRVLYPNY